MPARDERLMAVLEKIAPGTELREGLERIIRGRKGALVVFGYSAMVADICSGGFHMDAPFTSQRLSELAKMDGAIVLDDEARRIVSANVHLVPDPVIPTDETGTRHRTAERVALQTGTPVIAVSESLRIVTLYTGQAKHVLDDLATLLFRANQALATLERYRTRLDEVTMSLSALELESIVFLRDVCEVLQRAEMLRRISDEIQADVIEIGGEGRLLRLQHDELMADVADEQRLVVTDYEQRGGPSGVDATLWRLGAIAAQELLNMEAYAEALGFVAPDRLDQPILPRGYRMLARIPRLPPVLVGRIVARFETLQRLMKAGQADLESVDGVGHYRARAIREGLSRLAETAVFER